MGSGLDLLNVGKYSFDEGKVCNYAETVTLVGLPAFVTHNEASSDFSIPMVTDENLIGSYTITIRSEIQIPEDYTGTTFKTMSDEYDFIIFVDPCRVTSYVAS